MPNRQKKIIARGQLIQNNPTPGTVCQRYMDTKRESDEHVVRRLDRAFGRGCTYGVRSRARNICATNQISSHLAGLNAPFLWTLITMRFGLVAKGANRFGGKIKNWANMYALRGTRLA